MEQIWSSSLTTNQSLSDHWNTDYAGYLSTTNNSMCPVPDLNCYLGFAQDDLYTYINAGVYCNLTLYFLSRAIEMSGPRREWCAVYYNPSSLDDDSWYTADGFTNTHAAIRNITLPPSADNNPSFGLSFYTNSFHNASVCAVSNVSVWATPCNDTETETDREVIWSSTLITNTSFSEWEFAGNVSTKQSSACPHSLSCFVVEAYAEIYRYESTVGYHSVELDLWIKPSVHSSCSLYFITGLRSDNDNAWHSLYHNISNNETQFFSLALPDHADNNEVVGIAVYSWYGRCGVNNVSMTGIPIPDTASSTSSSSRWTYSTVTQTLLVTIVFISSGIAIIGFIDASIRKNDIFRIGSVLAFVLVTADWFSDIAFVASMRGIEDDTVILILFIASLYFIVLPFLFNLWQLKRSSNLWMDDAENGYLVVDYLKKYGSLMYGMAIVSGSGFAALKLINSGLFRMDIFDLRLKSHQISAFETKRIFSVVMLENVPQIAIHCTYAMWTGSIWSMNLITTTSTVLSACSIILSLLIYSTLKSIDRHTRNCDLYGIEFEVHSTVVLKRRKELTFQSMKLNGNIGDILSVNVDRVEQLKPTDVTHGLKFRFRVMIPFLDSNRSADSIDGQIRQEIQRGSLVEILKSMWDLDAVPMVNHLQVHKLQSSRKLSSVNGTEMASSGTAAVASTSTMTSTTGEGVTTEGTVERIPTSRSMIDVAV